MEHDIDSEKIEQVCMEIAKKLTARKAELEKEKPSTPPDQQESLEASLGFCFISVINQHPEIEPTSWISLQKIVRKNLAKFMPSMESSAEEIVPEHNPAIKSPSTKKKEHWLVEKEKEEEAQYEERKRLQNIATQPEISFEFKDGQGEFFNDNEIRTTDPKPEIEAKKIIDNSEDQTWLKFK